MNSTISSQTASGDNPDTMLLRQFCPPSSRRFSARFVFARLVSLLLMLGVLSGLLLSSAQPARGGEVSLKGGYGFLGNSAPFAALSLSFGKRLVFDFNGGVVFAEASKVSFVGVPEISREDVRGSLLYTVGLEIRGLVRKPSKKHNGYIGAGVDWLPQLLTPYPGVKAVAGYQISVLKERKLVVRVGTEYYFYGVLPASTFRVTSSIGYKF